MDACGEVEGLSNGLTTPGNPSGPELLICSALYRLQLPFAATATCALFSVVLPHRRLPSPIAAAVSILSCSSRAGSGRGPADVGDCVAVEDEAVLTVMSRMTPKSLYSIYHNRRVEMLHDQSLVLNYSACGPRAATSPTPSSRLLSGSNCVHDLRLAWTDRNKLAPGIIGPRNVL